MFKFERITPRSAAKYVVTSIISLKASAKAQDVITDYSRFDEDDLVVNIGGHLVGWYVAGLAKPYTDKMVDKTADFVVTKREQRKNRKQETPTEEK